MYKGLSAFCKSDLMKVWGQSWVGLRGVCVVVVVGTENKHTHQANRGCVYEKANRYPLMYRRPCQGLPAKPVSGGRPAGEAALVDRWMLTPKSANADTRYGPPSFKIQNISHPRYYTVWGTKAHKLSRKRYFRSGATPR